MRFVRTYLTLIIVHVCSLMYSNELYAYRNKLTNNKIKKYKKHQKQLHDTDNSCA